MNAPKPPGETRKTDSFSMTLAAVVGQVGCITLVLIFAALFAGMFIDGRFGTKPIFTVGLTIASIPVTLVAMVWIVRSATARINQVGKNKAQESQKEENDSGKNQ